VAERHSKQARLFKMILVVQLPTIQLIFAIKQGLIIRPTHILAGARNTNATHAKFISAGGDVTIVQVNHDENILATLMPVEPRGHIHECMKGSAAEVRFRPVFIVANSIFL
jgi:hypothetical protein